MESLAVEQMYNAPHYSFTVTMTVQNTRIIKFRSNSFCFGLEIKTVHV